MAVAAAASVAAAAAADMNPHFRHPRSEETQYVSHVTAENALRTGRIVEAV
jgi:hypothetical protein